MKINTFFKACLAALAVAALPSHASNLGIDAASPGWPLCTKYEIIQLIFI
ncbi:MAG: hypothetical protein HYZ45_10610 [Burkholderiales bacterium]|nr:hypothetical protein [Burkholderiales bacterium]